ncbi:MAG TPA: Fic family protein [Candidatus Caccocola faecigallinarum]|nr:Fic family protein [Candidatus Caccocola faecigallinarum]
MKYMTAEEAAGRWGVSVRRVRNYCAGGLIAGALRSGGRWRIPEDAVKPCRSRAASAPSSALLEALRCEKAAGISGGIYHKVQIELTYNSNHIEGGSLTHDQTRYIFETDTIAAESGALRVDDVVETANHFRCVDMIIEQARRPLSEAFIKKLHLVLKNGTSDSRRSWFAAGGYKRLPNEVGGVETAPPEETAARMRELLASYEKLRARELDDLLDFHYRFERIHPFQDGNGRVGRLILFKECLRSGVVPFIITDELRMFYYRGLSEWERERGYLRDTCLTAQDRFKAWLDYFRISY